MDSESHKKTSKKSAKKKKKKKDLNEPIVDPKFKRKDGRVNNGRNRGPITKSAITKHIRKTLSKEFLDAEGKSTGQTYMQKLVENAILLAISGDFKFFKEIIDRIDGPIPDFPMDEDGEGVSSSVIITVE